MREARGLAKFLKSKSPSVVTRAAAKASDLGVAEIMRELLEAYKRILEDPAGRDPGCRAQIEIATALAKHDAPAAELYCIGVRREQWEATWGKQIDTAGPVRALCAAGLARMNHPEAVFEACNLLTDETPEGRTGAIRALAETGRPEAELLLRYKARIGDEKPEVIGECFAALLRLGPKARSLPYVAEFLKSRHEEAAEAAALALGESRMEEAFPILAEAFARRQGTILWAMALLRHEASIAFLFEKLESGPERTAALALHALSLYQHDEEIRKRAARVVEKGGDMLQKMWRDHWSR